MLTNKLLRLRADATRRAGVMSELIDDYHFPILLVSDSIGIFAVGGGEGRDDGTLTNSRGTAVHISVPVSPSPRGEIVIPQITQ